MRKIAHWTEAYTEAESLDILCDLGEKSALLADSALGLQLASLIRKGKLRDVCEFQVPIDGSIDDREVKYLRQAISLFSKLEFLNLGIDREKVAIEGFMETEARCRETNVIWQGMAEGWIRPDPDLAAVYFLAQGHIQRILGERPSLEDLGLRFGPGATSLTKKRESSVKRKLGKGVSCSRDLIGWARALLSEMPHLAELHATQVVVTDEEFWGSVPVEIHTGAVSLVRKNFKTDRTTETQPTLNGMLQLAIGDFMAKRLRRVPGLDLRDQSLNQRLARIGSLTGELATLDLKSASNLIAVRLVRSLLPENWFSMLKAARVGITKVPGVGEVELEMFSGMGNGFTFPLQSLIFWSLARASATVLGIRNPLMSVYGDDIIVETPVVPLLVRALEGSGLIVNKEKSFVTGPFRESCGADFLAGIDVRPVYVKKLLTPAVLFTLHNGLIRKGFTELAHQVRQLLHPELILWGPDGYGDGHLICSDASEWRAHAKPHKRRLGYEGVTFDTYQLSAKRDWTYHPGDRILHVYASYVRGVEDLFSDSGPSREIGQAKPLTEQIPGLNSKFIDPLTHISVSRPWGDVSFFRAWMTGHGSVEEPSSPIPFGEEEDSWGPCDVDPEGLMWQGQAKACTFPGETGYRKVKIYTLGG